MQKHLAVASILSRATKEGATRTTVFASTTGFDAVNPSLCRVRLNFKGSVSSTTDKSKFRQAIQASLGAGVEPVVGSFFTVSGDDRRGDFEYVGLVKKGIVTRNEATASLNQKYSELSGNILMDNADQSVWRLGADANGHTVLSRELEEDLTQLLEMARISDPSNRKFKDVLVPMATVASYARFYNERLGAIDHGYVVGTEENGEVVIASRSLDDLLAVDQRTLVLCSDIHRNDEELQLHRGLHAKGVKCPSYLVQAMKAQRVPSNIFKSQVTAAATTTEDALDPKSVSYEKIRAYYKQLYAYAPQYFQQIEKLIDDYGF